MSDERVLYFKAYGTCCSEDQIGFRKGTVYRIIAKVQEVNCLAIDDDFKAKLIPLDSFENISSEDDLNKNLIGDIWPEEKYLDFCVRICSLIKNVVTPAIDHRDEDILDKIRAEFGAAIQALRTDFAIRLQELETRLGGHHDG